MKGEGYLFPDTYEFYQNESAHDIVHTLYAAFDAKITDAMRCRRRGCGAPGAASSRRSRPAAALAVCW